MAEVQGNIAQNKDVSKAVTPCCACSLTFTAMAHLTRNDVCYIEEVLPGLPLAEPSQVKLLLCIVPLAQGVLQVSILRALAPYTTCRSLSFLWAPAMPPASR